MDGRDGCRRGVAPAEEVGVPETSLTIPEASHGMAATLVVSRDEVAVSVEELAPEVDFGHDDMHHGRG